MGRLLKTLLSILPVSSGVMAFHFKCDRALQAERALQRFAVRVSKPNIGQVILIAILEKKIIFPTFKKYITSVS